MSRTQDPYILLKARALRLLARRDHSIAELKQKLLSKDAAPDLVNKVVLECQTAGWQNELRFAQSYIRSRAERLYGPIKVRYELKQRGVVDEVIESAFESVDIDWPVLAEHALNRKFGRQKADAWQEKAKRNQYLYQRGFRAETAEY